MALFINNGGPVKIRIGKASKCTWHTIRKGESVELTRRAGLSYGFSIKTTEGQMGGELVETKQISVPEKVVQNDFFKELCSIKGIGKKTAKDIIRIFPDREDLKTKLLKSEQLPFRDDIEKLLEVKYGR